MISFKNSLYLESVNPPRTRLNFFTALEQRKQLINCIWLRFDSIFSLSIVLVYYVQFSSLFFLNFFILFYWIEMIKMCVR